MSFSSRLGSLYLIHQMRESRREDEEKERNRREKNRSSGSSYSTSSSEAFRRMYGYSLTSKHKK